MTKHLLKLVWNRKRINFLITVEIFFSFIVLFGVVLAAVYYVDNYRQPLGFTYENVWCVTVEMNNRGGNARVSQNTKTEAGAPAAPVAPGDRDRAAVRLRQRRADPQGSLSRTGYERRHAALYGSLRRGEVDIDLAWALLYRQRTDGGGPCHKAGGCAR